MIFYIVWNVVWVTCAILKTYQSLIRSRMQIYGSLLTWFFSHCRCARMTRIWWSTFKKFTFFLLGWCKLFRFYNSYFLYNLHCWEREASQINFNRITNSIPFSLWFSKFKTWWYVLCWDLKCERKFIQIWRYFLSSEPK